MITCLHILNDIFLNLNGDWLSTWCWFFSIELIDSLQLIVMEIASLNALFIKFQSLQ